MKGISFFIETAKTTYKEFPMYKIISSPAFNNLTRFNSYFTYHQFRKALMSSGIRNTLCPLETALGILRTGFSPYYFFA